MTPALYERLFKASPNAYMVLDRELRYVAANDAYLQVVASTLDQIVGRNVFEAFPHDPNDPGNDNAKLLRESFERVLATGQVDHVAAIVYRTPQHTPDGVVITDRIWSATHTPVLDANGQVERILQHTVDVTDLAHARQQPENNDQAAVGVLRRAESVQAKNVVLDVERQMLRQLFQQAPVFTCFLSGPEHRFELANASYLKLLGHRDIIGRTVTEAVPEAASQGFIELLDRVYTSGEAFLGRDILIKLQHEPGGPLVDRYLDFVYQPIVDGRGVVSGIFVLGTDVTEQKLATAERERLATIVEQTEDFIGTADLEGNITFMNEAGHALLGLTAEAARSTRAIDVFWPGDLPLVHGAITKALEAEGRWRGELRMRSFATGETIPVDYNVFALRQAGALTGLASVTRDLRERRMLEQERSFLADAIPSQVWTANPEGALTYVNRQVTEYFGRTQEQMLVDGWQGVVHEDDLPTVLERWGRSLTTGVVYEVEFRLLRASDHTWRWHLGRAHAMRDAQGKPAKWYGTNVDIDDKRKNDAERDALIDALESSNKELDRFAYVASHDLKTPLRGIGNLAQWIEDDLGDRLTPQSREHLALMRGRVSRMDSLIDGVLRYSRSMKPDEHVQEVDVRDLIDVVVDLLSLPAGAKVTVDDGMPVLQASYIALQQVFLNLISNAVKHAGRPDVHVHVSVAPEGDTQLYRFSVGDDGRGIAPEHRERVWSLFQTLGDRGGGEGIGLSVVKRLVELQGGTVRIDKSKLGGAELSFTWPKLTARPPGKSGPHPEVKV